MKKTMTFDSTDSYKKLKKNSLSFFLSFFLLIVSGNIFGQVTLPGTSPYTQNFDGLPTLPTGWTVRTGATSTSLGTSQSLATSNSTNNAWAATNGNFRNAAAAESPATSGDNANTQFARTDRVLAVRPSGSFGDPGQAFTLQIENTLGKTNFKLSLKHQLLDAQGRTETYTIQYTTIAAGTSGWTNLGTFATSGSWGSTSTGELSLGTAFNNIDNNVWIRIVSLTASTGSGSRDTYGIDDFVLSYDTTPSYTLTYTAGANGTITGTTPQTVQQGNDGSAVTAVPNTGYHFVKWSDDSIDNPRTDTDVQADISVTANFDINTYAVTYYGNGNDGGTAPVDGSSPYSHGSNVTVLGQGTLTKTGYLFDGWKDGSNTPYQENDVISNITAPITLYAQWLDNSLQSQTITFDALSDKTYGDSSFNLTATSDSGLTVSYTSSNENVATISGNTVTIIGAGTTTITASQAGNGSYHPATDVQQNFTVNPKELTIIGISVTTKTYNNTTTASYTGGSLQGIVNSDDVNFTGTVAFANANAGTGKTVNPNFSLTGTKKDNYTLTQPELTGTIEKAPLTATAENKSKAEGAVNPTLTIAYTGFVSGQNAGNAAGFTAPSISTTAVQASPAGTYPITLSGGSADNYSFTLVNGTLTVNAVYNGTGVFEKITALNQLEDGYYVMVGNGTNAMNTDNSTTANKLGRTTVTVTDNKITNPAKSIVWKVETVSGNIKTIYNEDVEKFVSSNGNNTNITLVSSVTGNKEKWTASSSIQTSINAFRFTSDEQTTRGLVYSGTPGTSAANVFGQYATSNVNANFTQSGNVTYYDLALYKLVPPVPALSVSTEQITGLNYLENDGPSVSQSFTVSGENLNGSNVTVLADGTKFEISEDEEGDINGDYTNEITLTAYNGANKTIWVRLKAGQSVGLKDDVVLISGGGATDVQIALSGEVTSSAPSLSVDTEEIEDLGYTFGSSVSAPKIFKLNGLNLDGTKDVLLGLDEGTNSDFEISLSESSGYDWKVDIESYDGTPIDIYVRLKTGKNISNNYEDAITIITDYSVATEPTVLVFGAVTAPVINTNPATTVPAMTALVGQTGSEVVAISGTLTADVTAEIIGTNANQFSVNPASVTSAGGNMTVTYEPTTAGSHTATLKLSTNGNVTKELALTGTATLATPVATAATNITSNSFTANWNPVAGAESYELDVYTKEGSEAPELVTNGGFETGDRNGWDGDGIAYYVINNDTPHSGDNYVKRTEPAGSGKTYRLEQTVSVESGEKYKLSFWYKDYAAANTNGLKNFTIQGTGGSTYIDSGNPKLPAASEWTKYEKEFTATQNSIKISIRSYEPVSIDDISVKSIENVESKNPITGSPFTGITTTSHNVANLDPETEYYYKARAVSGDVTSDDSNEIKAETLPVITWSTDNLWLNDRQPNIEEDVIIKGALVINGDDGKNSFEARALTVNSGGSLTINADKAVTVENGIVNNGTITVESDGNLIQTNDAATNTGNITVKRIAKMKRQDYTYWSSPVSGQNLKLFSPNTLNNRFYTYNEADNSFVAINPLINFFGNSVNNENDNIPGEFESAAKGYAIRAYNNYPTNGTVQTFTGTFTGVPNNGSKTFTLKKEGDGYNLVGNPYPSNIDFDELYNNNSSVISNAAYFWTNVNAYNSEGGEYLANNYAQIVGGTGTPATTGIQIPTNVIKPGQGFLVEALGNGTLNFSNSIRTSDTDGVFINSKSSPKDRYWLKLSTPLNNFNTIAIVYTEGATNNYDRNSDGALMIIGSDSFYSLSDNQKLAIQGRAYPLVDSDVVSLGAVFYQTGNHTISISKKEGIFDNGQAIYLKDNQTGILTNLSQGSYSFTANAGESTGRFDVVYQSAIVLATDEQSQNPLFVYRDGSNFVIKSQNKKITGLEVYDPSGRLVYTTKANNTEVILHSEKLNNGMYILKINRGEEVTSKKIIK